MSGSGSGLHLVDTSVWVHTLVRRTVLTPLQQRVAELLRARSVATTVVLRLELLRGARDEAAYSRIEREFALLNWLTTDDVIYDQAARLGFRLRRGGLTVPTVDLVVAATAIAHDAILVHADRHYDFVAQRSELRVESYAG